MSKDGRTMVIDFEQVTTWGQGVYNLWTLYPAFGALLALMVIDVITGLIAAYAKKKISSSYSRQGMMGKGMILAVVGTGKIMELVVPGVPWGMVLALFFCVTEAISITENAGRCGVPIPKAWMDALEKLHEKAAGGSQPTTTIQINAQETRIEATDVSKESGNAIPGFKPRKDKTPSDSVVVKTDKPVVVQESGDITKDINNV